VATPLLPNPPKLLLPPPPGVAPKADDGVSAPPPKPENGVGVATAADPWAIEVGACAGGAALKPENGDWAACPNPPNDGVLEVAGVAPVVGDAPATAGAAPKPGEPKPGVAAPGALPADPKVTGD
jgi:hypothetical protein